MAVISLAIAAFAWGQAPRLEPAGVLDAGFAVADWRSTSASEGSGRRIVLVGEGGELALAVEDGAGGFRPRARALPSLAQPERTLLDIGPWRGADAPDVLIAASPAGLVQIVLAPPPTDEELGPLWEPLAARARFDLRSGRPTFADLLGDVNGDGHPDVVLPASDACELWLAEEDPDGGPRKLVRSGRVRVEVTSSAETRADALSDRLAARFTIPHLSTDDLDGDGRPDLLVSDGSRRAFHLQGADGVFPLEPTVEVDLALFRDPGAAGTSFRFGGTLTVAEEAQLTRRDLDGDGRSDFVLAHGRKVWVFHGGERGPQFTEPSAILKTADDVTALMVVALDADRFPDLLLLRVELPSIPTLLMGLFADWDVKVRASGYRNLDGRRFELRPSHVRDLSLRLPPIFDLLKDPYAVLERFREAGSRFRRSLDADLDGDGAEDLALVALDEAKLEVWFGRAAESGAFTRDEAEALLREQLFGEGPGVWDLDRLVGWLEGFAASRERRLTAGAAPDATFALAPPADPRSEDRPPPRLARVETVVPPGASRALLVLEWRRPGEPPALQLARVAR